MTNGGNLRPVYLLKIERHGGFLCDLDGKPGGIALGNVELAIIREQPRVFVELLHVDLVRKIETQVESFVEVGAEPAQAVTAAERPVVAAVGQIIRAIGEAKRAGGEIFKPECAEGL